MTAFGFVKIALFKFRHCCRDFGLVGSVSSPERSYDGRGLAFDMAARFDFPLAT